MTTALLVSLVSFIAFTMKGITGTGTSTVIVPLCALIVSPKAAIVLASLNNLIGGLIMCRIDPIKIGFTYILPLVVSIMLGSGIGAVTLSKVSSGHYSLVLGVVFLLASLWMFIDFKHSRSFAATKQFPVKASIADIFVAGVAGFCGGFIGINAPPLVVHFGSYLNKQQLRRLLVILFIPAAFVQVATFILLRMVSHEVLMFVVFMLPGLLLGIYFGNQVFLRLSEKSFRILLGVFLMVIALKMIYSSIIS